MKKDFGLYFRRKIDMGSIARILVFVTAGEALSRGGDAELLMALCTSGNY